MKKEILLEELFQAYYDARKGKRNTVNQVNFEIEYEKNLIELCDELWERRYKIAPCICFIVFKPVQREIFAADFRDRVVHHLIYNYINPYLDNLFIDDSYSCRKNKGTLYGIKRIDSFIRQCSRNYTSDCYVLKLDIQGYFMNINRNILSLFLESTLQAALKEGENPFGVDIKFLMYLIKTVLDENPIHNCRVRGSLSDWEGLPPSKSLFKTPEGCGLPIGNLTSQLFSNFYLHPLDLFVKEKLQITFYGRYVDDFVLIHPDKEFLKSKIREIRLFLKETMELDIHPNKIYLQHYSKGVPFLGAIIKPHRTYIANRTKKNFYHCMDSCNERLAKEEPSRSDLEEMRASINSYLGIMQHHSSFNIRKKKILNKSNLLFKYGYFTSGLNSFKIIKKKSPSAT